MLSASPEVHSAEPNLSKGETTPWPSFSPRLSSPPCRCSPPRATAYLLGSFLYLVGSVLFTAGGFGATLPGERGAKALWTHLLHAGNLTFVLGSVLFVLDGYRSALGDAAA
jgi:hypothetical protein